MKKDSTDIDAYKLVAALACGWVPLAAHAAPVPGTDSAVPPRPGLTWQAPKTEARAAPSAPALKNPSPLTLAELTDLALRNNPSTREAWAAANAQAAAVDIAGAGFWPSVDATASLTRNKASIQGNRGVTSGNAQTRFSPGISLSYVLFDSGARAAGERAARYGLLAANLGQNRTLQNVVLNVEQAYYQLLGARQAVIAVEETVKTAQTSHDAANERYRAGLATLGDVYQAETQLAQGRLQLRQAQGEAGKLAGVLRSAVGVPVNAALEIAPAQLQEKQARRTIEEYLAQAKASRPDLAAAEAQWQTARANIDAAAAQDGPALELVASGGRTFNNFQTDRFTNGTTSGSIGLNLRVPLFDGFRGSNLVRQAEARAEQQDAARERASLQVELEVWQAWFDLDTAEAAIDHARALLRSAGLAREAAAARYQAGVGNLPDLLLAQAGEANARLEIIRAEMGWYSSLSRLNNAIGVFSSESLPK